jgi:hypothetical protein
LPDSNYAGAADLMFLHQLPQDRIRNLKLEAAPDLYICWYRVSEVRATPLYDNRKCGLTRQGHHAVYARRAPSQFGLTKENQKLRELVRTNDMVLVSAVGALLDGANIHHLVLDQNMSIIEGSLGVLPRRILVHDDDNRAARQLLRDAGLAHELRADD